MTSRFIFTEAAETQLFEVLDYLADDSESAAVRVRHAIYDGVGNSPRGRASPDGLLCVLCRHCTG